jgi:hypothetical protein
MRKLLGFGVVVLVLVLCVAGYLRFTPEYREDFGPSPDPHTASLYIEAKTPQALQARIALHGGKHLVRQFEKDRCSLYPYCAELQFYGFP